MEEMILPVTKQVQKEIQKAMSRGDKSRAKALRVLLSEFKYASANERENEIDDELAFEIVSSHFSNLTTSLEAFSEEPKRSEILRQIEIVREFLRPDQNMAIVRDIRQTLAAAGDGLK